MTIQLKPIDQQVIVITGASSGIGLATAREAARRGAKVVLAARSGEALEEIARSIDGEALAVAADVSVRAEVERVAAQAIERFGRIDTWVNNAGAAIYGRLDEVSDDDSRDLFETTFWGVVYGSLVALQHLKSKGGAIINLGSEVSDAVAPLLGMYCAAKHAVKGFTDTLRIELEEVDKAPVAVTLIQPTAVDTPFPQHARNYMSQEAKLPTPQIQPEEVAQAILKAATMHTRAVKVGVMAKVNTAAFNLTPALADKLAAKQVDRQQYDEPPRDPAGALRTPSQATRDGAGRVRGSGGAVKH
ncbi:MAG: SDR family oxidoreductase [Polyangiales bacterium]